MIANATEAAGERLTVAVPERASADGQKSLSQVFSEARALIEKPECWIKNTLVSTRVDGTRCYCVWGALDQIDDPESYADGRGFERIKNDFLEASDLDVTSLPFWNDDPTTTHADVLAAFDRAIAYAQERGL